MKRLLRFLANVTLWSALAFVAGNQVGYHHGYIRGVRDIGTLIIELHDAASMPSEAPTKRDTGWRCQ